MSEIEPELSIADAAARLRTLGHTARLGIMMALVEKELSVGEIETVTEIAQPGLSQQLAVLRKSGLVDTRRDGKLIYYAVNRTAIGDLCDRIGRLESQAQPLRSAAARPGKMGSASTFAIID